jgi:tetratricopeptide (TPR) repeat protein
MGFCVVCGTGSTQQTPPAPTNTVADLYTQANEKFNSQNYTEAVPLYQKIVAANPYADRAWYNLARALYGEKKYAEAIPAYEKAFELGMGRPADVLYDIACCQALLGKKAEAMTALEKAMAKGFPNLEHIRNDDDLKSLHEDPKFRELAAMVDTKTLSRDEGWRYDLKLLARELKRVHYDPFRKVSREEFDAYVKKLHDDIPRLSDTQVGVGLMKLMRMAGDGHTAVLSVSGRRISDRRRAEGGGPGRRRSLESGGASGRRGAEGARSGHQPG